MAAILTIKKNIRHPFDKTVKCQVLLIVTAQNKEQQFLFWLKQPEAPSAAGSTTATKGDNPIKLNQVWSFNETGDLVVLNLVSYLPRNTL